LPSRLSEVPDGGPLTVVCDSGYRSSMAASLLLRAGRSEVSNLLGGMAAYRAAGREITADEAPATQTEEVPA